MGWREAWRGLVGKSSNAGPLIAMIHGPRPQTTPRNYKNFAVEGYAQNVVAYRSINEVTRSGASVPWTLFRIAPDGKREEAPSNHPLRMLLKRPNPQQAGSEWLEAVLGFFLIAGNSYVEAVGPDNQPPRELWTLRPDRMKLVPNPETGMPDRYIYTIGSKSRSWGVDSVTGQGAILHIKAFNPNHDYYGLSAVEPAAKSIDQRNEADAWNLALLKNNARPSGALVFAPKDGTPEMSPEQFARTKAEIDAQFTGASNAGRPMLLEGGLDWKEMGMSPKDMDFLQAKHTSSRDIALSFGVPPQLLGIPGDSTFSNYREARLALWEETVIPLMRHVRDEFNNWLVPQFERSGERGHLELDVDLDEIPALILRRERRWDMMQNADFLTINEKREAVGFGEVDGGDVILIPSTMLPLDAVDEDDADAAPKGGTSRDKALELDELAYGNRKRSDLGDGDETGVGGAESSQAHLRAVAGT